MVNDTIGWNGLEMTSTNNLLTYHFHRALPGSSLQSWNRSVDHQCSQSCLAGFYRHSYRRCSCRTAPVYVQLPHLARPPLV